MQVILLLVFWQLTDAQRNGGGRNGGGNRNGGDRNGGGRNPRPTPPERNPRPTPPERNPRPTPSPAPQTTNLLAECRREGRNNTRGCNGCTPAAVLGDQCTGEGCDDRCRTSSIVQCGRNRNLGDAAYNTRDVCNVTNEVAFFLNSYDPVAECDDLFTGRGEEVLQVFCRAIKQTSDEFAAAPLFIDWSVPQTFPFVCGGRAPSVCGICTSINEAFISAGDPSNVDWDALTRTVVGLFLPLPESNDDIGLLPDCTRSIRNGAGQAVCDYALTINSDFSCAEWAGLVAGCEAQGITNPEDCFANRLISTLIQGVAYRLHSSDYCAKQLESLRRLEAEKVVV